MLPKNLNGGAYLGFAVGIHGMLYFAARPATRSSYQGVGIALSPQLLVLRKTIQHLISLLLIDHGLERFPRQISLQILANQGVMALPQFVSQTRRMRRD